MSRIDVEIPPQGFEIVRDRIGMILADELYEQLILSGNYLFDLKVWVERFVALDKTELPCVTVSYVGTQPDNGPVIQVNGENDYHIDCYVNAVYRDGVRADQAAMLRLQRLIAVCWYILTDPKYVTLGFQVGTGLKPFIKRRRVKSVIIDEPRQDDATSSVRGRIVYGVDCASVYSLISPPPLDEKSTILRLNQTDKGYYYS